MTQAKDGDTVKVHYTGTLDDGTQFDSSAGRDPLSFTIGAGQVIAGFDDAARGMAVGDTKTVNIPCANAYGPREEGRIQQVEREQFPDTIDLQVGVRLQASQQGGAPLVVTVTEINETHVTLDANHPLAGQDLNFEIEMVEID